MARQLAPDPTRVTTRRARACDPECRQQGDIEVRGFADATEQLVGVSLDRVTLVATYVDIGDPRFRLWLVNALGPRSASVTIELVKGAT